MLVEDPIQSEEDSVHLPNEPFEDGYVQVYTGNGKGKTTAAIGLAVRAMGAGLPVFIGQFIKQGAYSEIKALRRFNDLIHCCQFGRGCWLRGKPSTTDRELAAFAMGTIRDVLIENTYRVVILDEILTAQFFGLVDEQAILELIDLRPPSVELVLTGRYASDAIINAADLVSEMKEIKHYYQAGVMARLGIES